MKILGIDPGYERCGIAIIEKSSGGGGGKDIVLFSDCIRTSAKSGMPDRLWELGQALSLVIKRHKPDVAAIEELYFAKNTKTAMQVAEARGVIQYRIRSAGLSCFEYHPNTIKIAITGHGSADKKDIAGMIPRLVSFNTDKKIDDELDAVAVALTHSAHSRQNYPQERGVL